MRKLELFLHEIITKGENEKLGILTHTKVLTVFILNEPPHDKTNKMALRLARGTW